MNILKYPTPSLLAISVRPLPNEETLNFLGEFLEFAPKSGGIGLAAPQVGKNIRVFWAVDELFINPVIKKLSKETHDVYEGCLSLDPLKLYEVTRHRTVRIQYFDSFFGKMHDRKFTGLKAQVIQHEYDHLEGKLLNMNTSPRSDIEQSPRTGKNISEA